MSHKHCPPKSKTVKIFGIEYTKPSVPTKSLPVNTKPGLTIVPDRVML
jgi:hypothetical protein